MPTRGRPIWARQAVDRFLAQTYRNKELIILDDMDDPSFPGGVHDSQIVYVLTRERLSIPQKRNLAAELASAATLIAAWDSDDISAPSRLATQLQTLLNSGKAVTGYHTMIFIDELHRRAGRYHGTRNYALGTSLLYRRDFWRDHPFGEHLPEGVTEDYEFVTYAWSVDQLESVDAGDMIYARVHSGNTSEKDMRHFEAIDWNSLEPGMLGLARSAGAR